MNVLSYPFRLTPNGTAATVEQGSDQYAAELLAVLALTRVGERELVPEFGIPDPAFETLELNDLAAGVELFGPPVTLSELTVAQVDDATSRVTIGFSGVS